MQPLRLQPLVLIVVDFLRPGCRSMPGMEAPVSPAQIAPSAVRYVKLGAGNVWFKSSIAEGRIAFGHHEVPHEVALSGDAGAIATMFYGPGQDGRKRQRAMSGKFASSTPSTSIASGSLWRWRPLVGFAEPEVHLLPPSEDGPSRYRELVAPWSCLDLAGHRLSSSTLSTRLTQVAAYRQTVCKVQDQRPWCGASTPSRSRWSPKRAAQQVLIRESPTGSSGRCTGGTLRSPAI